MPSLTLQDIRKNTTPLNVFGVGLLILSVSPFLGNHAISAGQILLFLGLIAGWVTRDPLFTWDRSYLRRSGWCLLFFVCGSLFSILWNWKSIDNPIPNLKSLRHFIIPIILVLTPALHYWIKSPGIWLRRIILANLSLTILAVIVGLIVAQLGLQLPWIKNATLINKRIPGLDGEIIAFAVNLQLAIIALSAVILRNWRSSRPTFGIPTSALLITACVAGIGIYFTYSRGPMVGLAIGLLILGAMISRRWFVIVVSIGLLIGGLAFGTSSRYATTDSDNRLNLWRTAALTFITHPGAGVGFREFQVKSVELKKRFGLPIDYPQPKRIRPGRPVREPYKQGHSHNSYLEALATTGVIGGIPFLAFLFFWTVEAARSKKYQLIFVPLIAAILACSVFDSTFFDSEVSNSFFLLYLLSQSLFFAEIKNAGPLSQQERSPAQIK